MREKRLHYNTISSVLLQTSAIICGFILSKALLRGYGSEVNGLVNSISQMLGFITFLELGVGTVIQSNLYIPIAKKDSVEISKIVISGKRFYRKLAVILLCYVAVLIFVLPHVVKDSFDCIYVVSLLLAMVVSLFIQYLFGAVDRIVLFASQRGYVHYISYTISTIVNTLLSVVLIKNGATVQLVKILSSLIFLIQPLINRVYIYNHFFIDSGVNIIGNPIKQKWNAVSQHIAFVVLENTDVIVLTLFSSLSNVSIYSVYHMVILGVKNMVTVMTNGLQSYWGDMIAKNELDKVEQSFSDFEWLIHSVVTVIFGSTMTLIIPFVSIYTSGLDDSRYIVPTFGSLMTLANGVHCLRLPYHIMIKSAGKYKETQSNYVIAALLNIVITVITVKKYGLIGVAYGTLVAMFYQTIWMMQYDYKNILSIRIFNFIKLIFADSIVGLIAMFACSCIDKYVESYLQWILLAVKVCSIWIVVSLIINGLLYSNYEMHFFKRIVYRWKK